MDIRHLKYILAISESGNISRASQKLYISQPTLSQFLTKMEHELGLPLFQRHKGVYSLTAVGRLYADYAKKVLALTENLELDVKRFSNTRRIRLGTSASRALQMLTAILVDFRSYYPDIELILSDNNHDAIQTAISNDELDLAFIATPYLNKSKKQNIELLREEIIFAAPSLHPYCQKITADQQIKLTSQQLWKHFGQSPFILQHKGSCIRHLIEGFFEQENFSPTIACTTSHVQSICEMVAGNIGVAFIPRAYAVASPHIMYFGLEPPIHRIHAIIYSHNLILEAPHKFLIELAKNYTFEREH